MNDPPGLEGTFAVLGFAADLLPTVVYTEGQLGQIFDDEPAEVKRVQDAFSGLAGLALEPERSLSVIDERIRALS